MIEVSNINKFFHDTQVLFDINGTFEPGRTNLVIGASGTGKSVLLKCIVGLLTPDEGKICYNDRDFIQAGKHVQTEIRREMGMLFQGGALFDSKTVEENVIFPLDMLTTHMEKDEKLDRVNSSLKRVGLENVNHLMPSELSGGMKKRVGIARAIVLNPKYLFCDEPNSGLDPQNSIMIDELIKEITEEYNSTTIIVTHDMNSVMEIGEYILFMHKGKKLWEGSNNEILGAGVQELEDFIYANSLMRTMRDKKNF